jgi:hypothetical protein
VKLFFNVLKFFGVMVFGYFDFIGPGFYIVEVDNHFPFQQPLAIDGFTIRAQDFHFSAMPAFTHFEYKKVFLPGANNVDGIGMTGKEAYRRGKQTQADGDGD